MGIRTSVWGVKRVKFIGKGGERLIPYENSTSRNDRTFDLFISGNLEFLIKHLMEVSNV
jgi:hypothetical protein